MLLRLGIPYDSPSALAISGALTTMLTGQAYATSAELARERGPFPAYAGSQWHDGILPPDTLDQLSRERGLSRRPGASVPGVCGTTDLSRARERYSVPAQ